MISARTDNYVGAVIGAISSASLYKPPRRGNEVLVAVMLALAGVLLSVPFVRSVWLLHVTWFGLGLCTATLDTGCQIMTRKVHGLFAGPWLALNTMMFAAAGIVTPLVALATHNNVFAQYLVVASCSIVGAVALYLAPMPEAPEIACKLPPKPIGTEPAAVTAERAGSDSPPATSSLLSKCTLRFDYTTELVFSFSVFWLIGGSVSLTSYVKTCVPHDPPPAPPSAPERRARRRTTERASRLFAAPPPRARAQNAHARPFRPRAATCRKCRSSRRTRARRRCS